jgi:hypothetical protein
MWLPWRSRRRRDPATSRKQLAPIAEYLFVDEARLDTYFQQISSPIAFESVPVYKGSLALAGPTLGVENQKQPRAYSRHEKLEAVVDYLKEGGFVGTSRPGVGESNDSCVFRLETCRGTRTLLPLRGSERGLAIWVCEAPLGQDPDSPRAIGKLYLLEDFPGPDREEYRALSGYSALQLLLEDPQVEETISQAGLGPDQATAFATRPLPLLQSLGARVAKPRTIRTLYRVRDTLAERDAGFAAVTIGYPIAIAEQVE